MPPERRRRKGPSASARPRGSVGRKLIGAGMLLYGLCSIWWLSSALMHLDRYAMARWDVEGSLVWLVTFGLSHRNWLILGDVLSLLGGVGLIVGGTALLLRHHRLLSAAIAAMPPWVAISVLAAPAAFVFALGGATFRAPASAPASERALAARMSAHSGDLIVWIIGVLPAVLVAAALVVLVLWLRRLAGRWREASTG